MNHPELFLIGILRALVEVAMYCLLGQGVLALLAGNKRHSNGIYKLFVLIVSPVIKLVRFITPPQILDRHLPFVAFFVLFWAWIGLAWLKRTYCEAHQLQCF
ncbi:hypothetical protein [Sulfuricystis multivorans]|uniref:hypothetical protein n=1 Tax=Sulfuricystis multivorans TaxID=2211108 RepID=UPI000F838873|nr:hypothetical protein [Sulfuricystis multivorans]